MRTPLNPRYILVSILILFLPVITNCQELSTSIPSNGVYAEIYILRHDFSNGIASANYERIFGENKKRALRIGLYPDLEPTISVPVTFTRITGNQKKHHFEYGFGFVYRYERFQGNSYHDIPAAMFPFIYRYQDGNGFYFRGGINLWVSWPILPSPGFSLGYAFP